eukprot:TRINITY_DN100698_c0_g1_i1.p1 TRINITY_DN100698_c0_g1~~TRINITY_DN100698_c0_g1_i1.p1  ORF type:complete len:264 (+),score=68.46 TRINITY_DN100698_c0_g1_i1:86-877(+)
MTSGPASCRPARPIAKRLKLLLTTAAVRLIWRARPVTPGAFTSPWSAATLGVTLREQAFRSAALVAAVPVAVPGAPRAFASAVRPTVTVTAVEAGDIGKMESAPVSDGPTTSAEDQRDAAALREEAAAAAAAAGSKSPAAASKQDAAFAAVPAAIIDRGVFKYVLLKITSDNGEDKFLVRGTAGASYHKDVAAPYVRSYLKDGFLVEVLGGGRISHDPDTKTVKVYGFSYGFPWVDGFSNEVSAEILQEHFQDYKVDWSSEGY